MSDSSNDNYPITDQPTRDIASVEGGNDSMLFAASFDESGVDEIPNQIGDYEIKQLLGAGGMGQVFLAEHTRMRRVVALKMLPVERMKEAEALDRFYEEVRAASRLMHPNIVTAFDAGEDSGIHYLAMEYVDGMTLTRVVSRKGPLTVGEAAAVIRQAALGLLHAHRAGIVHRDVKPGNLMRATDGTGDGAEAALEQGEETLLGPILSPLVLEGIDAHAGLGADREETAVDHPRMQRRAGGGDHRIPLLQQL
ncbi:MAG: serine/threonine protein kinase, partial [Pirellulales bacterium]|nr:serine/threonine protein kinase [Pirellulales bacterium]